jgi:hypothetical protein
MIMAKAATEAEVRAIVAPPFTDTWHPVAHDMVMDSVELSLEHAGLGVIDRRFELGADGNTVFAPYKLDQTHNGSHWQLGWRNAINKAFAVGFCAGTLVTICSNLMFSGDFLEFRKHTSGLDWFELLRVAKVTMEQLVGHFDNLSKWQSDLKTITLSPAEYKVLTFDAIDTGAVSQSKFEALKEAYKVESGLNGPSLYSFHGAGTRVMRENSLTAIVGKSKALNKVVDIHYTANRVVPYDLRMTSLL